MKIITVIFLCIIISINFLNAEKCYVCDDNGCERPGDGDIKDCSDGGNGGSSGKTFVNGAFGENDSSIYTKIGNSLTTYAVELDVNETLISWNSLTRWVCYVTKDKRRGCLIMSKGLCSGDKSLLGRITAVGDKISKIMDKATNAVGSMFTDASSKSLNATQKLGISKWMAEKYMGRLINNTNGVQYQLESCCEGDSCNSFASMTQKSTVMFILLFLSTLILV